MCFVSILRNEHISGGLFSFFSHTQNGTSSTGAKIRMARYVLPYICLKQHRLGV